MAKKIVFTFVLVMVSLCSIAQKLQYQVIAKAPRNMQTQLYGQAVTANMDIFRDGNTSVKIGTKVYNVVTVDKDVHTDTLVSVQFTTNDETGTEYIIKIEENPQEKVELMRNCVIVFASTHPYDWTYYFCSKPQDVE